MIKKLKHKLTSKNSKVFQSIESWNKVGNFQIEVKNKVCITALRNPTWIEWAIYCAFVIRQYGYESHLIIKKSEIKKYYSDRSGRKIFEYLRKIKWIKFIELESLVYLTEDKTNYYKGNMKEATAALAYNYHIESNDIVTNLDKYGRELEFLRIESAESGAKLKHLFKSVKFHQFICYSGIIWDTPNILKGAIDAGQETVCVEGWAWRAGHMIYNFGAPALEYNVKGWMKHFGAWDDRKELEMKSYFGFLDGNSNNDEWLKTFHNVQRAKVSDDIPSELNVFLNDERKVFLLACNVIGDSSLLNRETIFKSHRDFIDNNIKYFESNPSVKLVIRAHPAEEWVTDKVKIKLGEYSKKRAKGIKNIFVIDSNVKLNTFSLMPYVNVGLVWVSSVGADMVVRGKPIIQAAATKYYGLGIGDEPKTIEEYFELIDKYSKTEIYPTKEQIQRAKEYLYLVFKGFSYEAHGRNFRADTCRLNNMPAQNEHDAFYKILMREMPAPDIFEV